MTTTNTTPVIFRTDSPKAKAIVDAAPTLKRAVFRLRDAGFVAEYAAPPEELKGKHRKALYVLG